LEDGLSQSQVFDICQDSIGRMWFTTFGGGITIYDGKNVEYITNKEGLPSNSVHCLFVDSHYNIWIGTDNGVAYYNENQVVPLEKTIGNQLEFWEIAEDLEGNIWLGSDDGLFVYKDSILQSIPHEVYSIPSFIIYNDVFIISGLVNGLGVYNGKDINTNFINNLDRNIVTGMYEDNYNNLWLTTTKGLMKYYEGELTDETSKLNLEKPYILAFHHDIYNRYWIGTETQGIILLDGSDVVQIKEEQGIRFNKVEKIYEDNLNNIWVGTDGGGASVFRGLTFTNYTFERILHNNFVWSILVDSKNRKWFGTDGNGVVKYENGNYNVINTANSQLVNNHINAIYEDSKNRIWFGTSDGVSYLNGNTLLKLENANFSHVVSICEDSYGNIWFGTFGEGLIKYDNQQFEYYSIKDGLGDNYVWCFFPEEDGSLLIGTEEGLTTYENNQFHNLTVEDGLVDPSIWSISKGCYGNYWIITDNGLTWYDKQKFINYPTSYLFNSNVLYVIDTFNINHLVLGTEKGLNKITYSKNGELTSIKYFGKSEGFLGIECNANAITRDNKGVFWIGTVNGVSTYNSSQEKANLFPPEVYLKKIKLFYEDVDWEKYTNSINNWTKQPQSLFLDHEENNLTFEYIGINYRNPEKVRYQYILEGNDQSWHPATDKNEATYTNIPPGEYVFKVKAVNEDGIWSKPYEFSFTIDPPFWQETAFIFIITIIIISVIYLVFYLRTNQLQKARVLLSNKVKERTAELNEQKEELQSAVNLIREQKEELESTLVINQKQKDELEKANIEIKESAKLKEIFLANTSHEIRTPLNVINGYTNLLLNMGIKDKGLEYLKNIKTSSNSLLVVINDILDFSKIEAGKLKIEKIEFDLHNLVRDFHSSISVKAREKKLDMKYSIQNTVPKYVRGDPFRINQILVNIVRNAIKFTEEGGLIKIFVKVKSIEKTITQILFIIEDNGIGIDEEKLKSIFESFTQASTDTTRKYGGTGLGLSIVKNLVDLQKGSVDVESEKFKGSRFTVCIPLEISTGIELLKKEKNFKIDASRKLKELKILLVEDNPLNVTLAIDTILMYNNKIKIDVAVNGKQAIEKLSQKMYDIIIMDIQMPEMDGYDTTKYIRSKFDGEKQSIPILGMSAHAMKEEKEKCFGIGMNEYLTKPFVPEDLFSKIEKLTGKIEQKGMKPEVNNEIFDFSDLKHVNISNLIKIYNNDPKKLTKILNSFTQHLPDLFSQMEKAIHDNNSEAMKISAHSLKTSLKYIGAKKQSDIAKYIELNALKDELKQIIFDNFDVLKVDFENILDEIHLILEKLNEKIPG
jgi:signal transduction histidine kinase/ligand-binding sensor domain-containing protein/DNA-binding response OmpR family regulator